MTLKIACPKCNWEPDGGEYWRCTCGYVWDTFTSAGRCPCCGKNWEQTSCVPEFLGGCRQLSPHLDWYPHLDRLLKTEIFSITEIISGSANLNSSKQNRNTPDSDTTAE